MNTTKRKPVVARKSELGLKYLAKKDSYRSKFLHIGNSINKLVSILGLFALRWKGDAKLSKYLGSNSIHNLKSVMIMMVFSLK